MNFPEIHRQSWTAGGIMASSSSVRHFITWLIFILCINDCKFQCHTHYWIRGNGEQFSPNPIITLQIAMSSCNYLCYPTVLRSKDLDVRYISNMVVLVTNVNSLWKCVYPTKKYLIHPVCQYSETIDDFGVIWPDCAAKQRAHIRMRKIHFSQCRCGVINRFDTANLLISRSDLDQRDTCTRSSRITTSQNSHDCVKYTYLEAPSHTSLYNVHVWRLEGSCTLFSTWIVSTKHQCCYFCTEIVVVK